jgi:hypothetical protein
MRSFRWTLALLILLALGVASATAQDDGEGDDGLDLPDTGVWVTTQDFSSFRAGPGTGFERLAVIDPEVTLMAVGRTASVSWVQVVYEGELGWINAILLVWSGNITTLPVDGINPAPFVRRAGAIGVTTRETPLYTFEIGPEFYVGSLPEGTQVELTGRLGGTGFFRFQILYEGQLYWVGSWNIRVTGGNYLRLLDVAYLFPYGRLVNSLESSLADALGAFNRIQRIWTDLSYGVSVSCGNEIPLAERDIAEGDVSREPLFAPAVTALDAAIADINYAISTFEDVCNRTEPYLEPSEVTEVLGRLATAERNLVLAGSLLEPLRIRNPLLQSSAGN